MNQYENMKWRADLELAKSAAVKAGRELLDRYMDDAVVTSSIGKDIKTKADLTAEQIILAELNQSEYPLLAEESGSSGSSSYYRWLIDPLDGTMNFSRGFPMYAISIGLWSGMNPVLGVVLDLARNDLYSGVDSVGAWKNGEPIEVSSTDEINQSILATGFPVNRDFEDESIHEFIARVQSFKKIRMIGSAALSLCMVACGKFDSYFEEDIMLWDIAGGAAIVKAAGGRCVVSPGTRENSVVLAASNGVIDLDWIGKPNA